MLPPVKILAAHVVLGGRVPPGAVPSSPQHPAATREAVDVQLCLRCHCLT